VKDFTLLGHTVW